MFESFVIVLREGIEAALVIGIILVVLRRGRRRELEGPVFLGLGVAVLASIAAAIALSSLPINEEAYEGVLFWTSALFVATMMWWVHRKAKTLRAEIEKRVGQAIQASERGAGSKEAWALGLFTFLMVFREGAEVVMFLSAVNLTTDAMLSFIGGVLGLGLAVTFCVLFVRGSLQVNLRRFFAVTEWVLGIFVAQLVLSGYHEFSEAGVVPANQTTMAIIGPIMRNNSLFLMAIVAIPLFIWLTRSRKASEAPADASASEKRLVQASGKRERFYRSGAVCCTLVALLSIGAVFARESVPKELPPPEAAPCDGDSVVVPLSRLDDGKLHRMGLLTGGRMVRFLAIKTSDNKYRTALDACELCGSLGYIQDADNLVCLNCTAEINPFTVGEPGGCNPIPLKAEINSSEIRVPVAALQEAAHLFAEQSGMEEIDPVCGMRVKMNEAAAFETVERVTYYFCNAKCQQAFKADPKAYVK